MQYQTFKLLDWLLKNENCKYNLAWSGFPPINLNKFVSKNFFDLKPKTEGLREKTAEYYKVSKENVAITNGATEGNFFVFSLLFEKNAVAIIESPVYSPLCDVLKTFGYKIKFLKREFAKEYKVNCENLKSLISKNTKLIVLTNLHNPSGVLIKENELKEILEIAKEKNVFVLVDEIFREMCLEKSAIAFHLNENAITTSSFSKMEGLGGLRIGWILANKELTKKIQLAKFYSSGFSAINENIALKIFENKEFFIKKAMKVIKRNLPIVEKWIKENELQWVKPNGGIICFPKVNSNSLKLAKICAKKHSVLVSPGEYFGEKGHIRLGYGVEEKILREGLKRIEICMRKVRN